MAFINIFDSRRLIMKKSISLLLITTILFLSGCGNLSPRHQQKIDNTNGKIGEVETLQNSLKAEVGKLQSAEISNSRLDRLQQGLLNFQKNEENNGVQILSGSGGLMLAFLGFVCLSIVAVYYRSTAKMHEKTANILAERIVNHGDPLLINAVFEGALHTTAEANVLSLIKKHEFR